MLVLIIGGKNPAGSDDFDFHTDYSAFQGVIWANNDCKIREGAYSSGPVLCDQVQITPSGQDATDVPTFAAWPPLGSLLDGQLYGSTSASPDFLISPGPQSS